MIMDLNEIEVNEEVKKAGLSVPSSLPPTSKSANVIKRVIMTMTEITIYPNGQTYYKSRTWEQGKPTVVRKKIKKTSAPIKKVEMKKAEVY
jgi:hypothetical protein